LGAVGVDIVLYCCSAYRAMNAAALKTYEAIRRDGTQRNVLEIMQSRADLYKYLDYDSYEPKRIGAIMSDSPSTDPTFKPKKSVALSGVVAGNTALCTVGRTGNDLQLPRLRHPRDRRDLRIRGNRLPADSREALPNQSALARYKEKLKLLRGCPAAVRTVLEALPATSHPMDVLRTGVSALGCCVSREGRSQSRRRARYRRSAARLPGLDAVLLVSFRQHGRRIEVETDDDSVGGHFLHLLHQRARRPPGCARCTPR
jgi:citrate synthase